jgi:hypothetical protein
MPRAMGSLSALQLPPRAEDADVMNDATTTWIGLAAAAAAITALADLAMADTKARSSTAIMHTAAMMSMAIDVVELLR